MTEPRHVRLVHVGGDTKLVDEVTVLLAKQHVSIYWPTAGIVWFHFGTGLCLGTPRGPWRLADEEREHYCALAGKTPKTRALKPLKRRKPNKQDAVDARQLWLVKT